MQKNENRSATPYVLPVYILGLITNIFSNGLFNVPVFAWIWPVCLLYAFRYMEKGRKLFIASAVFLAVQGIRYFGYTDTGFLVDECVGLFFGALILLPFLCDRMLYPCLSDKAGNWAVLLAPSVFAAASVLGDLIYPTPLLAYSQASFLPLIQSASLVGSYGLSFLIFCFSAVVLRVFEKASGHRFRPLVIYAAVFTVFFVFGAVRLSQTPAQAEQELKLGLALTFADGDYADGTLTIPSYEENAGYLRDMAAQTVESGAELLCFAEESFEFDDVQEELYLQAVSEAASQNGIGILMGADIHDTDGSDGGKKRNEIFFFNKEGELEASYLKTNLLPGPMEASDYVRGNGNILHGVLNKRDGTSLVISSVICFDSNDGRYVAGIPDDTDILLIPAWGWRGCRRIQSDLGVLRAVENGVSLVSPSIDATSITCDRFGRIFAKTICDENNRKEFFPASVDVVPGASRTVYHSIFIWIDWLYPILAAVLILLSVRRKKS